MSQWHWQPKYLKTLSWESVLLEILIPFRFTTLLLESQLELHAKNAHINMLSGIPVLPLAQLTPTLLDIEMEALDVKLAQTD